MLPRERIERWASGLRTAADDMAAWLAGDGATHPERPTVVDVEQRARTQARALFRLAARMELAELQAARTTLDTKIADAQARA